jgi:hypothetical protein
MYDPTYRTEAEREGLGVPENVDPKLRPVYGFIPQTGFDATSYGNIEFVLKPEVNFRSTLTVGDSLLDFASGDAIGTPVVDPGIEGFTDNGLAGVANHVIFDDPTKDPDTYSRSKRNAATSWDRAFAANAISYIECQVQGGVTLKDVDKVIIHLNKYESDLCSTDDSAQHNCSFEQEVHDKLKALGINVEIIKNSW